MEQKRLKKNRAEDQIGAASAPETSKDDEKTAPPIEKRKRIDDTAKESPAAAGNQKEQEEKPVAKAGTSAEEKQVKKAPLSPTRQQKFTPQKKYAEILNEDPAKNRDRLRQFVLSIGNPGHRESLLKLGILDDPTTFDEPLLMHRAASKGILSCIEVLLSAGAEVNSRNAGGKTPLHLAVEKNRIRVVNELIVRGADVNATDKLNNDSVLHYAVTNERWECITALVEAGADARVQNDSKETPADLAEREDAVAVAAYLRKASINRSKRK